MKTKKQETLAKKPNPKEVTLLQLSQELKKLKNEMKVIKDNTIEIGENVETVSYKLRNDIPVIFQNESGDEIFKTFNLNHIPRIGEKMNLRPSPDSCCLNNYLMHEFDLTEENLTKHVLENKTFFSFVVSDVATNLFVLDSHPDDEWDDMNGINFNNEEEFHMSYVVTLVPNNLLQKKVLVEKIG